MSKKSKRFLAGTMSAIMVVPAFSGVGVALAEKPNFTDVDESHIFAQSISSLEKRGIINGYPDGTFKPNAPVTRGQAAKILAGVLQLDTENVVDPGFSDIPKTHPFYGPIAALKQAGIIDGYPDGTFKAGNYIERQHMAKMLAGALNLQPQNPDALPFTDVLPAYKNAIAVLYELNITTGATPTTFDSKSPVLRGQLAAFVFRAEQALASMEPQPQPEPEPEPQQPIEETSLFDYTEETITIEGKTYALTEELKKIFSEPNREALQNATLQVTIEDDQLISIDAITFNHAGTKDKNVVFDAATEIDNIHIAANNVALKNVVVMNDLTVAGTVSEDLVLNNVEIKGNLKVEEAKPVAVASLNRIMPVANTTPAVNIIIVSSSVGTVIIAQSGTSISSDTAIAAIFLTASVAAVTMNATIGEFIIESDEPVEVDGDATIDEVRVESEVDVNFLIAGAIGALIILNGGSTVGIAETLTIATLTIPEGSTAEGVVANYSQVASQISVIVIPNAPTTGGGSSGESSGSGSTGGSSGGSSGGSTGGSSGGSSGGGSGTPPVDYVAQHKSTLTTYINAIKQNTTNTALGYTAIEDKYYTESSLVAFRSALDAAVGAAQKAVDTETSATNLQAAIDALKKAVKDAYALLQNSSYATYRNKLQEAISAIENNTSLNKELYTEASIPVYEAAISSLVTEAKGYLNTLTKAEQFENYINILRQQAEYAQLKLVLKDRTLTASYVAKGTVTGLPEGVTYANGQFTIANTFNSNRFDFEDNGTVYTATDESSSKTWSIAVKQRVIEGDIAIFGGIDLSKNLTLYVAGKPVKVSLSVDQSAGSFAMTIQELGVYIEDMPTVFELTDSKGKVLVASRLNGFNYSLTNKEYVNHRGIYVGNIESYDTANTSGITYYEGYFLVENTKMQGTMSFKNKSSQLRVLKLADGAFTVEEPANLVITIGNQNLTLTSTEAIPAQVSINSGNVTQGTVAVNEEKQVILTLPNTVAEYDLGSSIKIHAGHMLIEATKAANGWSVTKYVGIVQQPQNITLKQGEVKTITATATASDNSQLTYQWYRSNSNSSTSGGLPITGATTASYTIPSDSVGEYYYYVVATDATGNVKLESKIATVNVVEVVHAAQPAISVQPLNFTLQPTTTTGNTASVTASVTDGGKLSYQWYVASSATAEGTPIAGATAATYIIPATLQQETYYYVVITNTNSTVNGNQTASIKSEVAKVKIPGVDTFFIEYESGKKHDEPTGNVTSYVNLWDNSFPLNQQNFTISGYTVNFEGEKVIITGTHEGKDFKTYYLETQERLKDRIQGNQWEVAAMAFMNGLGYAKIYNVYYDAATDRFTYKGK